MPTYDYLCQACGHDFEKFQSITASPTRKCPVCGKLKVKRLIGGGGGLIFKGAGFYATDYRSDSYKSAAKAEKDSTSSEGTAKASDKPAGSDSSAKSE
jgi:putative FmdB family regulatory protein